MAVLDVGFELEDAGLGHLGGLRLGSPGFRGLRVRGLGFRGVGV